MKYLVASVAVVALLAFTPRRQDTPLVTVSAECVEGQLGEHSVSPDTVTAAQGQDIDWELDDASNATAITVGPKHAGQWPWGGDEKFTGGKGSGHHGKAHGSKMKNNAKGAYAYNIQLTCPDGNGGTTVVTIDPHIIIH